MDRKDRRVSETTDWIFNRLVAAMYFGNKNAYGEKNRLSDYLANELLKHVLHGDASKSLNPEPVNSRPKFKKRKTVP